MLDPSKVRVLNELKSEKSEKTKEINPVELSKKLHKKLLKLKSEFLSEDGNKVNYINFRESPDFHDFEIEAQELNFVNLMGLNDIERKAFFINIYNTLTIDALARFVNEESTVLQLEKFWQMNAYKIGDLIYSLDDIEHGVLRCNKLHPTYKDYFFKEDDPRREFVQPEVDPRIHFALNCGAKSCPPIRLFSAENLEAALDMAARNFCQNDIYIDMDSKTVSATKILMWYGEDFGVDEKAILQRVSNYLTEDQQNSLNILLESEFKLEFAEYDWKID